MARLPKPGGDDGTWGQILNDFLAQTHKVDGTLKDNVVTSNTIAPGTVTVTEIADGSITTAKLATSLQTSISGAVQSSAVGQPSGVASLGTDGKVPTAQLPASSGGTTGAVLWNTATAPTAAQNGDLWLDASSSTTEAYIRARINNQWVLFATATKPTSGGGGFTTTSMPTNATATPAETSVVLQWNAPIEIAGTLQGYRVYQGSTQLNSSSIPATTLTYTVQGLTAATPYTFTIRAVTTSGEGAGADVVVTTTAAGGGSGGSSAPAAPTNVQATGGNAQATVSFTGSSGATSYTVTANPGGVTGTGSSSPITVTGLTNGTSYTFTVTATNANGTSSPSSQSASVTPAASGGGSTGTYPSNELAWYMKVFPSDSQLVADIPSSVNTVRLSFILQSGGGIALAGYTSHGQTVLAQQCNARRAAGGFVVAAVGGGAGGQPAVDISNPTAFANGVEAIQTDLGCPLDGIDWDLEYNADVNQLVAASQALKDKFGSNFVITYSAGGASDQTAFDNRRNCGVALHNAGLLTSFSWQFYDVPVTLNEAKGRLQWIMDGGIPADKMMVGMFVSSDSNKGWSNAQCVTNMTDIKNTMGIHRAMIWTEGFTAENAQWGNDMRTVLGA